PSASSKWVPSCRFARDQLCLSGAAAALAPRCSLPPFRLKSTYHLAAGTRPFLEVAERPEEAMGDLTTKPGTKVRPKTKRPRLYKVILLNDDYTPREFVIAVLKAVFRMNEDQAYRVMM